MYRGVSQTYDISAKDEHVGTSRRLIFELGLDVVSEGERLKDRGGLAIRTLGLRSGVMERASGRGFPFRGLVGDEAFPPAPCNTSGQS